MIHARAHVDADCVIGPCTAIWQFASVIRKATIGTGCNIGSGAIIDGASVGDRTLVGAGAQLHPGTRIGNDVFVGPGVIFCNDLWPQTGKRGFDLRALLDEGKATVIVEDGASIGAGAIILPGVTIGADAMVAAGVVCRADVLPGMVLRRDGDIDQMPADVESRRMRYAGC